jgi:hypothetical protein
VVVVLILGQIRCELQRRLKDRLICFWATHKIGGKYWQDLGKNTILKWGHLSSTANKEESLSFKCCEWKCCSNLKFSTLLLHKEFNMNTKIYTSKL